MKSIADLVVMRPNDPVVLDILNLMQPVQIADKPGQTVLGQAMRRAEETGDPAELQKTVMEFFNLAAGTRDAERAASTIARASRLPGSSSSAISASKQAIARSRASAGEPPLRQRCPATVSHASPASRAALFHPSSMSCSHTRAACSCSPARRRANARNQRTPSPTAGPGSTVLSVCAASSNDSFASCSTPSM